MLTRIIPCECCGGDRGSFDDRAERWIKCRACEGEGEIEVETQPVTLEDLEFGPIYTRLPR